MSYSNMKMAGIATALAAGALGFLYLQRRKKRRTGGIRRNMSFTSAYMAIGTYPEKAKYSEPIINAAMYFEELPTEEEIVEQAIKPMLAYDRLARIPNRDKAGTLRLPSPPLDPRKMVRKMVVSSLEELYRKIQDIFNEMLGDNPARGDLPWWEFLILEVREDRDSFDKCRVLRHALLRNDTKLFYGILYWFLRTQDRVPVWSFLEFIMHWAMEFLWRPSFLAMF
jgi:hypothetical protein